MIVCVSLGPYTHLIPKPCPDGEKAQHSGFSWFEFLSWVTTSICLSSEWEAFALAGEHPLLTYLMPKAEWNWAWSVVRQQQQPCRKTCFLVKSSREGWFLINWLKWNGGLKLNRLWLCSYVWRTWRRTADDRSCPLSYVKVLSAGHHSWLPGNKTRAELAKMAPGLAENSYWTIILFVCPPSFWVLLPC